ncbi:hypothetical protein X975_21380, partial [Stegodyphus mimosarum]
MVSSASSSTDCASIFHRGRVVSCLLLSLPSTPFTQ